MKKVMRVQDPILLLLTLIATVMGLVFIFDAGYPRSLAAGYGPIPREFKSQLMFLPVAIAFSAMIGAVSSEKWKRISKGLWFISMISLLLVFVPGLGYAQNGAIRWIKIGPLQLQPAEFMKISVILYLAGLLANRPAWPKKIKPAKHFPDLMDRIVVPKAIRVLPAVWVLLAVLLIDKEPDLGTAAIIAMTAFIIFIAGGVTRKSLIVGGIISMLFIGVLIKHEPYRMERIEHHIHRWDEANMDDTGYQTVQSELAMASGGIFGNGPGSGRAKHVLPAATTDFITATIGEEFGIVGMFIVLGVLALIVVRLLNLAARAPTPFAKLVLSGVGAWIGVQACVNVYMANGAAPAIGIPLPFISSGGSSLIALWAAMGLCQAVLVPQKVKEESLASGDNRWRDGRTRLSRA